MQLLLRRVGRPENETLLVTLQPNDTVALIDMHIKSKIGLRARHLVYRGKVLQAGSTLREAGLCDCAVVIWTPPTKSVPSRHEVESEAPATPTGTRSR